MERPRYPTKLKLAMAASAGMMVGGAGIAAAHAEMQHKQTPQPKPQIERPLKPNADPVILNGGRGCNPGVNSSDSSQTELEAYRIGFTVATILASGLAGTLYVA